MRVYTTAEVAEILQTKPERVTALVRSGRLIAVKGLKEYRFTEQAINDYLNSCTTANEVEKRKRDSRPDIQFFEERRKTKQELVEKGEWISVKR